MSLIKKLETQPQREKSGALAQSRFDYQAHWGLTLILEHHKSDKNYAVGFEFHDDVILLDDCINPTSINFYQIKTKGSGFWSISDLFKRSSSAKAVGGKLPSHMGKLFSNYVAFPEYTAEMHFVSNAPIDQKISHLDNLCFKKCSKVVFLEFLKRLQEEHSSATEEEASRLHYTKADLHLNDAASHLRGKLHQFVVDNLGELEFNLNSLFRAVIEDCRTKSKCDEQLTSLADIVARKAITRTDAAKWIENLRIQQSTPSWIEIDPHLSVGIVERNRLRAEWKTYRSAALNPANEAIRAIRRKIRQEISSVENAADYNILLDTVYPAVLDVAIENMSPFNPHRLKVMIIYEATRHGTN